MNETPNRHLILVIDDDEGLRRMLQLVLEQGGYRVVTAATATAGLRMVETMAPRLAILDWCLPDMTGLEALRQLKVTHPRLPVILLTGYANLAGAVDAIKEGATDYLAKPMNNQNLLNRVREAVRCNAGTLCTPQDGSPLRVRLGSSPAITRTIEDIERVAPTDFAVNLFGETGAGKEVVAQVIHENSHRARQPFVAVDCGAIPDSLIENELFGHERGAFTGADRQQIGKLEAANGGTLFLDEITNLSLSAQARLLRVLQERVIYRVGGTKPVPIDVRLISASNRQLADAVSCGGFRADLLYRICDYRIVIPPLRERREDIPWLAERFLTDANRELGKGIERLSDEALQALLDHSWPGNVRELRSVIRRAVLIARFVIDVHHLDLPTAGRLSASQDPSISLDDSDSGRSLREIVRTHVADVERQVLHEAMQRARGNKAAAARLLQIDYKTIHSKLKAYGL